MSNVVIYSASWCVPCQTAKKWFDDKGIAYVEKQVDSDDPSIIKEFTEAGFQATPTILINDQVIVGHNPKKFAEALAL
tara:strand:- start:425 stop:658 length:234 start_codon:yes stop_codon:yes gene_type:complete